MDVRFRDLRVESPQNVWTVSGRYDTDDMSVKLTRIEGDITRIWENRDFKEALYHTLFTRTTFA